MQDRELYQKILGLEEPRRVDDVELLLDSGEIRVRISHPPDPKGNLLSRPAALASPALGLVWDFDNRLRGADTNGTPATRKRIFNYRLTPLLISGFLLESEHGAGSGTRVVAGACG